LDISDVIGHEITFLKEPAMGHERIGFLPRSKRWREIVEAIATSPTDYPLEVSRLADNTLRNVSDRFRRLHKDEGVQAAFGYLVSLATSHLPKGSGMASAMTGLEENPSPARIAKNLNDWVNRHAMSREYAELACRAAADTIAKWTRTLSKQRSLFDESSPATRVWSETANGRGFCEMARIFFSHFTERYLRYFLEREASAKLPSVEARQRFNDSLHEHVDQVSKHAFETSKITQSFAAGWFNNYARSSRPTNSEIENFLAVAFNKIHEELERETGA
jgi:hypothetical protein